jgi:FG-GAP-like repeat
MRKYLAAVAVLFLLVRAVRADDSKPFPSFRMQEIDTKLEIGYAVILADINGDGKPDIVVVDTTRVYWYENPTWKRRTIIDGQTKRDNVCVAAYDIDGDGQLDLALGADWRPFDTKTGGTLQWLKRGKTLDDPWTVHTIDEEPTVHRIRFADLYGEGKPRLVVGPIMGRNSTKEANWTDGSPVRMLAYKIPKDPIKDRWVPDVIDESLHVVHNFSPIPSATGKKGMDLLTASYDGVHLLSHNGEKWSKQLIGAGNQDNPKASRGASEIKSGRLKGDHPFIATIEPWHGNQVVVYTRGAKKGEWQRTVVDEQLRWGHAVWCADLDGDGSDELIIGVRDDLGTKPDERYGVRIYKAQDAAGTKWTRHDIDAGGVAVEDLTAGDLNGDGKIHLIAVGRKTKNVRIYWNEGKK